MQNHPSHMSDEQLIGEIKQLVSQEYRSLAELLSLLAEMDDRKLYAQLGYSSLFVYMVEVLHLSEDATYKRIQAARTARRYPVIYSFISEGKVNLTAINILSPLLTEENHEELLRRAAFKSKRDVERMRAEYVPMPDVPDMIRNLPTPTCAGASSPCNALPSPELEQAHVVRCSDVNIPYSPPESPARRDAISPLSEQRVKFQFTGSEQLRGKIERKRRKLKRSEEYPPALSRS